MKNPQQNLMFGFLETIDEVHVNSFYDDCHVSDSDKNERALVKRIYNRLEDELSKMIFHNRLGYYLTGNFDFITCMIDSYHRFEGSRNSVRGLIDEKSTSTDNIVIYGAGLFGQSLMSICDASKIATICDSDIGRQGRKIAGKDVISPEILREKYPNSIVIIAVLDDDSSSEIFDFLIDLGFSPDRIVNLKTSLQTDLIPSNNKMQYFDRDILPHHHSDREEIFVDAGCFDFKSSLDFIKWSGGKYKKIIAFEPNPNQYPICIRKANSIADATVHPYGLWNKNMKSFFDNSLELDGTTFSTGSRISSDADNNVEIDVVRLDDILDGEMPTFIKMDVEGAELNALKGAEQTIQKYHPRLAICVYHKPDDILRIPEYILSLNDEYRLYLRHYSTWIGETVLYAV